jgi:membrane protease YdiL (CAAX protease family)
MPDEGTDFEAWVAPARARPELWRLVAGTGLAIVGWVAAFALALVVPLARQSEAGVLIAYLASFAGMTLGVAVAARWLQRRSARTLIGPAGLLPRAFAAGAAVAAGLGAVSVALALASEEATRQAGLAAWAARVPLVLAALLIQTSAEEIAFRGFLMQGLAARFRSPLVWMLLPALLFGVSHLNLEAGAVNAWLMVGAATVIGLVLADVTVRTGSLSAAMGLHFANNAVAVLVLAPATPVLSGLALWVVEGDPSGRDMALGIAFDLAIIVAAWAVWRIRRARSAARRSASAA